jgi:hypothetical protein
VRKPFKKIIKAALGMITLRPLRKEIKRRRVFVCPHKKISRSELKRFKKNTVKKKSVLMVEPNPYHGEIIPGFVKYWRDAGYAVDLIVHPRLLADAPLARYESKPETFCMHPVFQRRALKTAGNYDFVFMTTSVYWADGIKGSYINWLGQEPHAKTMLVEHNVVPYVRQYGHGKYVDCGRSFTLGGGHGIPMLNPHYFGRVGAHAKNEETIFSAVVNIEENAGPFFESMRELLRKGARSFHATIAGRSPVREIPGDLKEFVSLSGPLPFQELWKIYDEADFLIPMLNPDVESQERYKGSTVSGTWQASMGFLKPMLIEKSFAPFYRQDGANAIVYSSLADAMERAIGMGGAEYEKMRGSIRTLADEVYAESLNNLKRAIEKNEK